MNDTPRDKAVRELAIKARFLNYVCLFSVVIFLLLLIKLAPGWQHSRAVFILALFMEIFSIGFFVKTRRLRNMLERNPRDEELVRAADFLSRYYYPKFIFRRKRNRFIIPDDED